MGRQRPGNRKGNNKAQKKKNNNNNRRSNQTEAPQPVVNSDETNKHLSDLTLQLTNEAAHDREYACGVLSNLVLSNPSEVLTFMYGSEMVPNLIKLLEDSEASIVAEAMGCLNNIGIAGGTEVCERFTLNNGVFTLGSLIKKIQATETDNGETRSLLFKALENAVSLLWLLCESSNKAVDQFAQNDFYGIILDCMNVETFGFEVATVAGQLLYSISEDNNDALTIFSNNNTWISHLCSLLGGNQVDPSQPNFGSYLLLRSIICGILYNLRAIPMVQENYYPSAIVSIFDQVLKFNSQEILMSIAPVLTNIPANPESQWKKSPAHKKAEAAVNNCRHFLNAKRLCLEILTNLCSGDDASTGNQNDYELDIDGEFDGSGDQEFLSPLNENIVNAISTTSIVSNVLHSCSFAENQFYQLFAVSEEGQRLVVDYTTVQTRALGVVNNLFMAIDSNGQLQKAMSYASVWDSLVHMAATFPHGVNKDLLPVITNAMWSLLRRMSVDESLSSQFSPAPETAIESCKLSQFGAEEEICVHVAGLLGILGKFDSVGPAHPTIASTLKTLLNHSSVLVISESLNSIYDLYAEPETNALTSQCGLGESMTRLLPHLQANIRRGNSQLSRQEIGHVKEACLNLKRFLQYKQEQGPW